MQEISGNQSQFPKARSLHPIASSESAALKANDIASNQLTRDSAVNSLKVSPRDIFASTINEISRLGHLAETDSLSPETANLLDKIDSSIISLNTSPEGEIKAEEKQILFSKFSEIIPKVINYRVFRRDLNLYHLLQDVYIGRHSMPVNIDLTQIDEDLRLAEIYKEDDSNALELLKTQRVFYEELSKTLGKEKIPNPKFLQKARINYAEQLKDLPYLQATLHLFSHVDALSSDINWEKLNPFFAKAYALGRELVRIPVSGGSFNNNLAVDARDMNNHLARMLPKYDALITNINSDCVFSNSPVGRALTRFLEATKKLAELRIQYNEDIVDLKPLTSSEQKKLYRELDLAIKTLSDFSYMWFPKIVKNRLDDQVMLPRTITITQSYIDNENDIQLVPATLPNHFRQLFQEAIQACINFQTNKNPSGVNFQSFLDIRINALSDILKEINELDQTAINDRSRFVKTFTELQLNYLKAESDLLKLISSSSDFEKLTKQEDLIKLENRRLLYFLKTQELLKHKLMPYTFKRYLPNTPQLKSMATDQVHSQILTQLSAGTTIDELIARLAS